MRPLVFGMDTPETARQAARKTNPCLRVYGSGPDGAICKLCRHLIAKKFDKTYYKCALRANTNGPATDHRVRWPACGRYEKDAE